MSVPGWCRVGAKVVCILRRWSELLPGEEGPAYLGIYTISEVMLDNGECWLRFVEIRNPVVDWHDGEPPCECRFAADKFRPLVDTTTDEETEVERRIFFSKGLRVPEEVA
jgi:hypothetical protein